ncbi:MAG: hypothetical protein K6L60_04295 [Oceanobacter sp.]
MQDGVHTAYQYNANDQLIQQGGVTYQYDDNGNLLSETEDGIRTDYQYSNRNKLVQVSSSDGTLDKTYQYDPDGIRIQAIDDGQTTDFVVDSNRDYAQVVEEWVDNSQYKQYLYGLDLISQQKINDYRYYQYDGLGSTRALTDVSGTLTDQYHYDAFGTLINQTGNSDNDYLYTGEQYDSELDQYYLRARYYDQGVGRFTQLDEWAGNSQDPITLNKYLYGNADPVRYVDPTGRFSIGSLMASVRTVGIKTASIGTQFTSKAGGNVVGRAIKATGVSAISVLIKKEVTKCLMSRGEKCMIPNLVVIGSNHREAQEHIDDVQNGRGSNGIPISPLQTYKKGGNGGSRSWYSNKPECKGNVTSYSRKSCDEWPFFTTQNGGSKGYVRNQVSLRLIDHDDNVYSGQVWGRAVRRGKSGDKYLVVPHGPTSFYYSNGKFGF